jgi:AbrB family looped-hinge helix DNA binding protein
LLLHIFDIKLFVMEFAMAQSDLQLSISKLPTTSAKIRALAERGIERADIARTLGIRYQHVRNVLENDKVRDAKSVEASGNSAARTDDSADRDAMKVRLGPDGRVVIPAAFRDVLSLKEGDVLFARLEGGEIHLLTPHAAMRRVQAMVREFVPEGVSLVDELIEDRRREAERENEGG